MYMTARYTTHKAFKTLAVSNKQLVRKGNKIPMLRTQNRDTGQSRLYIPRKPKPVVAARQVS